MPAKTALSILRNGTLMVNGSIPFAWQAPIAPIIPKNWKGSQNDKIARFYVDRKARVLYKGLSEARKGKKMSKKMGYKESLDWVINNDDNEWLSDIIVHWDGAIDTSSVTPSVTINLLADIHGQDLDKAIRDLYKKWSMA
jgi:hypothetical protein